MAVFLCIVVSVCGCTFVIAIAIDALHIISLHIKVLHTMCSKMFRFITHVIKSLTYLFYSKKWNVLRNRLDSCTFTHDQLFLGVDR
eukprot:UN05721